MNAPGNPPLRTDRDHFPNYRTQRHRLYGEQEGVCNGCDTHFLFRVMEVDHILPLSRGGTDHPNNLQVLCPGCNRSKGDKTMAEWRATIAQDGEIQTRATTQAVICADKGKQGL